MLRRFLMLVLLAFPVVAKAADQSSRPVEGLHQNRPHLWALEHAEIVVRPGVVVKDATIVIRGKMIESVGKNLTIPAAARRIDLTGHTVYAGLIDAYSEVESAHDHQHDDEHEQKHSAGYWNPSVTPEKAVADQFSANKDNPTLRQQGVVAQFRAPSDGVIRGVGAVVSTAGDDPATVVLNPAAGLCGQLTVASRGRTQFPGSPMGAVALARQTFYDAQWYQQAWTAAANDRRLPRPERNTALQALQPYANGIKPLILETSDEQFALRAQNFAAEFGLNLIIRGSGHEYRRLDEVAGLRRPIIVPLNFPDAPNVSTTAAVRNATLESLMHWDIAPENPSRLQKAGVRMMFCTDGLDAGGGFLKALRKAVQRGLSREAALASLTTIPAEIFELKQLGVIESGRLASLVISEGDLFDEEVNITETWVAGERFEHSPDPLTRPEGNYDLQLTQVADYPTRLFANITEDEKLEGRISLRPIMSATRSKADKGDDSTELTNLSHADFTTTARFQVSDVQQPGTALLSLLFSETNQKDQTVVGFGQVVWPNGDVSRLRIRKANVPDTKSDKAKDKQKKKDPTNTAASYAVNYPLGAFGVSKRPTTENVAFKNATVWTSGPLGIIEDGTVLIQDGLIVAVGNEVPIPAGTRTIDLQGMHLTPGIIDCHSHMATDGGVNESTQAITCEVRIGDFIDDDDITIYRQLAGGVTTSNILHGSANPIGGQNQVIKLRWGSTGDEMKFDLAPPGVKFALGENVKQANWGDDYTTRYPQTRMGVEQIFRDSFAAAMEYAAEWRSWKTTRIGLPPRRNLELDALAEMVEGKRWIHCHSYRQDEILSLIKVLDDHGVTIGTFQHILEGYKVADAMAEHGAMGSAFADWWAYKFEVLDAIPYAGAIMHQQGVNVSFNSDDAELATRLNQEAAKAVKYGGVSPTDALKFVTLNPAIQLRIEKYVGSIETGKHADLAVWTGPPLSNFSHCQQTWVDGRLMFDRNDDQQRRDTLAQQKAVLVQKILSSKAKMRGVGEDENDPSSLWPRHDEFCHHSHDGHDHGHDHSGH